MATYQVRFPQQLLVYNGTGLECIEVVKIHNRIVLVKRRVVKPTLRQSSDQRHLPAFEPEPNTAPGARFLSFMAFAAGLSVPRTFTATEALDAMLRTVAWASLMKMHHVVSPFPSLARTPRPLKI